MEKKIHEHINARKAERTVRHRKQQQEREVKRKLLKQMDAKEQQKLRDKQRNRCRNEEREARRTAMVAYHEMKHRYSNLPRHGSMREERDTVKD